MNSDNFSNLDTGRSPGQSYYLKLGRETIHGLSPGELERLHDVIIDYFDRENEIPLANKSLSSDPGQYSEIEKITDFGEGEFQAWYNVSCGGALLQCLPTWQVLDLFLLLLSFFKQVEGMDIQCTIPGVPPA